MERAEEVSASLAPAPVFVDDTGRRGALTRRAGRVLVVGFAGYIGLMVVGFARDPRVGPIGLPTFGLPSLGLVVPPAPSVLGEQSIRTDSEAELQVEAATGDVRGEHPADGAGTADSSGRPRPAPGGPANKAGGGAPDVVPAASGGASLPPLRSTAPEPATTTTSATTTTTARDSGNGSKSPTTTTSTTMTSTTTTPTSAPGRGSPEGGEGTGPVSAPGPDGSGPPGQQRKPTTRTTTG